MVTKQILSPKIRNEASVSAPSLLFHVVLKASVTLRLKRTQRPIDWKEEINLFLFAGDMIIYVENLKESIKTLQIISEFIDIAGYKINIKKSIVFLYSNNQYEHMKI
jgi:hypothetical protein